MKQILRKIRFVLRRLTLKRTDFTIISNNCWGGLVSEYYGLIKNSPTIGLFFFAPDYIKFVSDLKKYISKPLRFIETTESVYYDELVRKGCQDCIVGKLDDIEIYFLHYISTEEARIKWNRRCKRINWNNIYIKFSEMNKCTRNELEAFDKLPFKNKVMFTHVQYNEYKCAIYYPGYEKEQELLFDTKPIDLCLSLRKFLNQSACSYLEN